MMVEELRAKVREWDSRNVNGDTIADAKYGQILALIEHHSANEWRVYLPAEHPDFNPSYMERLATWIGNLTSEADQKLLLEYALHISFFSHDDFVALYRTALNREVSRWVASQVGAKLDLLGGDGFNDCIQQQIHRHTWFCPVTDSMDINEFYKVNHLVGIGHRPAFATLQMLAESVGNPIPELANNVLSYMANPSLDPSEPLPPLERIVILEDIVGSGTQCLDAVRWVVSRLGKPVLFVPLILCPNGEADLRTEEKQWGGQLTIRPVITLSRNDLLGPERQGHQGWPITPDLEELATRHAGRASIGIDTFGYKNTGCSLATFSNTPDNTLPIVHNKALNGGWEPIFPRVHRG